MNKTPKITLLGAGPGDPDLISVKGVKALQSANVVLYDALIDVSLLQYAPHAEHVFVGKRGGKHYAEQNQINQMLVDSAINKGHVVRLKGGDPFVFGRGHEELLFAQQHQIPVEIIPGISSSIAVPELQQIPVTLRGVSESFWVLTACTKNGKLSDDIKYALHSSATLVILMGVKLLPEIVQLYLENEMGNSGIAIIQNGTLPDEKMVLGKMNNIIEKVYQAEISSPAIIVIGEVVKSHPLWENELTKFAIK